MWAAGNPAVLMVTLLGGIWGTTRMLLVTAERCSRNKWAPSVGCPLCLPPEGVLCRSFPRFAQLEFQRPSYTALDRRISSLFFTWGVFNVFLGAMLVIVAPLLCLEPAMHSLQG